MLHPLPLPLSSCLGCIPPLIGLPSLRFYAVGSSLFLLSVCFCLCSLFYRDDVLCWLLLARPFLYAFHAHLRFPVDLVWFRLSCDHGWIRSGSVNVRKQQKKKKKKTVSEKKTEAMHLWSHPHTTSNALRIEAAGQRYKQTTEFVYLGGAISESADLDIEIKRRIGAAWASVRKYSSQLYDRRNARLSLKIRLFKAEVMEAMLYGCATWTMRSQDFSSLRTAHHKLLLRIIGFRRKDRIGYKPLSYREVLERTGSERIETTIRKRQLGFAGALVRQGDSRLSKRVMFGRLAVQGPKRGGRPATSWVDCLQKNLEAFGAVPRKGKGRKWVVFGVVVKNGRDWMTAAKNMGKWHRGVERGAEALDSAWRRADLRQSNVQLQREVSEVVQ